MRDYRMRDMHMRRMQDMRRGRDYGRMADYSGRPEHRSRRSDMSHSRRTPERDMYYSEQPYEPSRDYARRVGTFDYDTYYDECDYGGAEYVIPSRELKEWTRDLMDEVRSDIKQNFSKEQFARKYKEFGFSDDMVTEDEFFATALMIETDYGETLAKYGMNNLDVVSMLAKNWLDDKDSDLRFGEKLAAYYYKVVCLD